MNLKTVKNKRVFVGIVVAAILLVLVIVRYGYEGHLLAREEIETKTELYKVSLGLVNEKEGILRRVERLDAGFKSLKAGVLTADRIPVAAAELQKLIKGMGKERGIKMASEKVLHAIKSGDYVRVPVEFQFQTTLPALKGLIYDIESSSLILGVPRVKIKTPELKDQREIKATIVVEGVMEKERGE